MLLHAQYIYCYAKLNYLLQVTETDGSHRTWCNSSSQVGEVELHKEKMTQVLT